MELTKEDLAKIKVALKSKSPWYQKEIEHLKPPLKEKLLIKTSRLCCYCQRDFTGEFNLVIDIEHIAPSSAFKKITFQEWNLSVACKRCNMRIKNKDISFIKNKRKLKDKNSYDIIHPNFEEFEDHLIRIYTQCGRTRICQYAHFTEKGKCTYEYFKLHKLELSSFDSAQGIPSANIEYGNEPHESD